MEVLVPHQRQSTGIKPERPSAHHCLALDGLRGIAILAVFFYHFGGGQRSPEVLVRIWSTLADTGWMGVDLFFVLSGFLITGILFDSAAEKCKVRNFYARRSLRIFPLYYGVLFLFLILTPVLKLHWKTGHLLYFVYFSNMMPVFAPGLASPGHAMMVGHLWSLAIEEQFYLVWPFIVWWVKDRKKLLLVCLAIMLGAFLLRAILVYRGVGFAYIFPMLPTRIDTLVCGGAAALLVRGPSPESLPVRIVLLLSGSGVLAVLAIMRFSTFGNQVLATVGYTIFAIFFAGLVVCAHQDRGWIAPIGRWPVLRFFGRYSYGLYMYHGLLFVALVSFAHPIQRYVHSEILGGAILVASALGVTIAIAMLSYHFFEAPILKLKRRFA